MRSLVLAAVLLLVLPAFPGPAEALPTPGLFCDAAETATGRVFPEAMQTNDFVGFSEAVCGLRLLEAMVPDRIEVIEIGQSVGWTDVTTGAKQTFSVLAVEVTNELSSVAREDKVQLLFQLSVHGNEKDGREGGVRAIEDLVRGIGMAETYPELVKQLDYELLIFTFPNPDGWVHEELEYRTSDGPNPFHFTRGNGNGMDLNRNWPTVGWMSDRYSPLSEPEMAATYAYLKNFTNLKYATDIHGMLIPADGQYQRTPLDDHGVGPNSILGGGPDSDEPRSHYLLTMIAAGRMNADEWRRITALSELIKERVNEDPELAAWHQLPATGAWGGEANEWGMAVDAIGYEDSGFTGDFFTQDHGLNVPDIDFEMSYNHLVFDNYYPGAAQVINQMAIASVRQIVRSMMDMGALDVQVSIETHGARTLVVRNPVVITNAGNLNVTGYAAKTDADDAFDTAHRVFAAAPADYFTDLIPFMREGARPGILDIADGRAVDAALLSGYDRLVIPGSAVDGLSASAIAAIKAWTEKGGRLVLTDSALALLEPLGLAKQGSVKVAYEYTGSVDIIDRDHTLVSSVRGLARQMYVAVPLGFSVETNSAPNWYVNAAGFSGDVVGLVERDASRVSLGAAKLGAGEVSFLGVFLPDPTDEFYHPYGLDSYSATYTANQVLRNALGWEELYAEAPVVPEKLGQARALQGVAPAAVDGDARVPAPAMGVIIVLLAAVALIGRPSQARRR